MKGSVHAVIGATVPAGLVLSQRVTLLQGATMAAVAAGFALLPDIDHPHSCATKALGTAVHKVVHRLCKTVVSMTSTRWDRKTPWLTVPRRDPYHRTLTHTLAAAVALWCISYGVAWSGATAMGAMSAFGVFLLWPLHRGGIAMVVLGAVGAAIGSAILLTPWLLSLAVAGGYTSHIVADACTKSGVPALWPIRIRGKRWWNIRLLGGLVASGSVYEKGPAVGVSLASNVLLLLMNF